MATFDLSISNQTTQIENDIKTQFYGKLYVLSTKTQWIRAAGPLIGVASGVLTLAFEISLIFETIIKGLANILGSPFFKNCHFYTGATQLTLELGKHLLQFPFSILGAAFSPLTTTINTLIAPQNYLGFKTLMYDPAAYEEYESIDDSDESSTYESNYVEHYLEREEAKNIAAKEKAQEEEFLRVCSLRPSTLKIIEALRYIQQQNLSRVHSVKLKDHLNFISKKGFDLSFDETGSIAQFHISEISPSVEEVLTYLYPQKLGSNIEIHFEPSNYLPKNILTQFLEKNGSKIDYLSLDCSPLKNHDLRQIISYCYNIKVLSIRNTQIEKLPYLPKLQKLNWDNCTELLIPELSDNLKFILSLYLLGSDSAVSAQILAKLTGVWNLQLPLAAYKDEIFPVIALNDKILLDNIKILERLNQLRILNRLSPSVEILTLFLNSVSLSNKYADDIAALNEKGLLRAIEIFKSLNESAENLSHFSHQETKSFFKGPFGQYLLRINGQQLLENSSFQEYIKKIFPPNEIKNRGYYPIEKSLSNGSLTIKILPTHPLDDPEAILELFRESDVKFIESLFIKHYAGLGIDQGGLTRQFFSQTLMGLCKHSKTLSFEKPDVISSIGWGLRPTIRGSSISEEEIDLYTLLGSFLGLALRLKSPIGNLFSEALFVRILSFRDEDLNYPENMALFTFSDKLIPADRSSQNIIEMIETLMEEEPSLSYMLTLYRQALLTPIISSAGEKEIRRAAQQIQKITSSETLEEIIESGSIAAIQKEVRELLLNFFEDSIMKHLQIAFCLARGMRRALPFKIEEKELTKWNHFKALKVDWAFSRALQGSLNVEDIKENILFQSTPEVPLSVVREIRAAIFQWLDDHKDDTEKLSNFLSSFTGASALFNAITFTVTSQVQDIRIRTCDNRTFIPSNVENDFLKCYLDSAAAKPFSAFNIQ